MKTVAILIAAAAGLWVLVGTLAAESGSAETRLTDVGQVHTGPLPSWHPPVSGTSAEGEQRPSLPEGHPPIPEELVCPATGAIGKPGQAPRSLRPAVEGLVTL